MFLQENLGLGALVLQQQLLFAPNVRQNPSNSVFLLCRTGKNAYSCKAEREGRAADLGVSTSGVGVRWQTSPL